MPTYDYVCERCEHQFEEFQSITAKPLRACPECGKRSLKRLIGAGAGVIFKGSGFYQTDYRSEGYKKAADADKPRSDAADTKSETPKPESKIAAAEPKAATTEKSGGGASGGAVESKPPKGKPKRGKS